MWESHRRRERFALPFASPASVLAFSPDGRLLAVDAPGGFALIDLRTGRTLRSVPGGRYGVAHLRFSPGGQFLLTRLYDGTVRLYGVREGRFVARLRRPLEVSPSRPAPASLPLRAPTSVLPSAEHRDWLGSVAFSPSGRLLAVAGTEGEVRLYAVPALKPVRTLRTGAAVRALAFAPDGVRLAVAERGGRVALWNSRTGRPLHTFPLHTFPERLASVPHALAFSASGRLLAAGDAVGNLSVWDLTARTPLRFVQPFAADDVERLAFSGEVLLVEARDDHRAVFGRFRRAGDLLHPGGELHGTYSVDAPSLRLWRVDPSGPRIRLGAAPDGVPVELRYNAPGTRFAVRYDEETAQLWDARSGRPVAPPFADQPHIESLAFSPDGRILATGSEEGRVLLRSSTTGRPLGPPLPLGIPRALSLAFSPDGHTLAVGSEGLVVLWDVRGRRLLEEPEWDLPQLQRMDLIDALTYTPDGRLLVGVFERHVYVWDAATLRLRHKLPGLAADSKARMLRVSPDGKTLLVGYNDNWTVAAWSLPGFRHRRTVTGASGIAFSPDGRLLALGGHGTLSFYDAATLTAFGDPAAAHTGEVRALAFSPDSRTLLSADRSGGMVAWRTDLRGWAAAACRRAGRNLSAEEWTAHLGSAPYRKLCPGLPAPRAAVRLLLEQSRRRTSENQLEHARTLYRRALGYALETRDPAAMLEVCRAALSAGDERCTKRQAARG